MLNLSSWYKPCKVDFHCSKTLTKSIHRICNYKQQLHWKAKKGQIWPGLSFPIAPTKQIYWENSFQGTVFTDEDLSSIPELSDSTHSRISSLHISPPGVAKLLPTITVNKASGPDNIHCWLVKERGEELAPYLADIFPSSLDGGQLPEDWGRTKKTPALNKGNIWQAETYRPVSVTFICCKLLEHKVCRHLNDHLDQHNLLSRLQYGFRTRQLCESQLLTTWPDADVWQS